MPGNPSTASHPAPGTAAGTHLGYRADIDGIRALAIGSVMLFHAGLPGVAGGFAGVDVFFVLSGYLIASQILLEIEGGRFSMLQFWTRRSRRIVPAMATMMMVTLVAGWFTMFSENYRDLGRSAVAQSLFGSNFYFWIKAGYFAGPSELKPLLHTWSVAVEEQYYLAIPLLLWLSARRGRTAAGLLLGALLASSLVCSVMTTSGSPDFAFYLLPSRGWELLVGCMLALMRTHTRRAGTGPGLLAQAAGAAGLAMVLASFAWFNADTPWPAPAALLPCLGTALLVWSGSAGPTAVARLLSAKPLVAIGILSYSLYLWHWPVLSLARYLAIEPLGPLESLAAMAASVPLAVLSYRFVETPCRRGKAFAKPAAALGFSAAMLAAVLAAGAWIDATGGAAGRPPERADGFAEDQTAEKLRQSLCRPVESVAPAPAGFCRLGDVTGGSKVLLLGDSFSGMYLGCLERYSAATGREVWFARERVQGVHPLAIDAVRAGKVTDVVLAYSWRRALQRGIPEIGAAEEGQAKAYDHAALLRDRPEQLRRDLRALVQELRSLGARVHIVDAPPSFAVPVPLKLSVIRRRGGDPATLHASLEEQRRALAPVHAVFDELERDGLANVIRPTDALCGADGTCPAFKDGHALYSDDAHLSEYGASLVDGLFMRALGSR